MPTPIHVTVENGVTTYREWPSDRPLPVLTAEMERIRLERAERDKPKEPPCTE